MIFKEKNASTVATNHEYRKTEYKFITVVSEVSYFLGNPVFYMKQH